MGMKKNKNTSDFLSVDFVHSELKRLKELGIPEEKKVVFIKNFIEDLSKYSLSLTLRNKL